MKRKPLLVAFTLLGTCALLVTVVVVSGVIDVSALHAGGPHDRFLGYVTQRSLRHHAPKGSNPLASDQNALRGGVEHYQVMCAPCHGGPGMERAEFAAGMHPPPPDLTSPEIQAFTDGMLFQAIYGGVTITGMPAFGGTHSPNEIWTLVSAVRNLKSRSPGKQEPSSAAPAERPGGKRTLRVSISQFKFVPETLEVKEGDSVEWTNSDFVAHTATSTSQSFDTGKLDPDASKRIVMDHKGTFPYVCTFHRGMKGTITVQ